ncbi:efflux RND transporter periplasmic adaptor subunit [bacterium]|nr:efflux RND transporter periplasmic adaptor subunit [bacterium]
MAGGCNYGAKDAKKDDDKKEQAIPVEVAALSRGPIESTLKSSWYLEAEQEVKVLARASNRVKELLVEEGSEVKKDEVIARLEDNEQRTALEKAQNQFEKSQAEFNRVENLYQQKLVSEQAYTDAKFELRQLQLSVEEARRQLDYTEIRAPIDGTISQRLIKIGDLVSNNQQLFDIVDFDSIVAYLSVSAMYLPQLRVDQPARISSTVYPDRKFEGYIKRISPVVEPKTGNVKVTIGLRHNKILLPGMYVEIEIVLATKPDALLISRRAVVLDGEQFFVYRLKNDRRVERLLVEPAMADKFNIEPAKGFAEGDQIVVAGQTGLKDGALVRLPGDPDPEKDKDKPAAGAAAEQAKTKPANSSAS